MVEVQNEDLDIEKIAASGQCFRLCRQADGSWLLAAHGRALRIYARPGGAAFDCSEAEFDALWKTYFDLETDYARFRAAVPARDRYLSAAAAYSRGVRILRQDPWEMLVTFLISQRKSIPAIRGCVEALARAGGERCRPADGAASAPAELPYAFPSPQRLAQLTQGELAACALGYRCGYVAAAARAACEGKLDAAVLGGLGDARLQAALEALPGVGPKVANCVLLFGYHRLRGFPRDVWILRVEKEEYGGHIPLRRYRGFEGVIQQYLFFYGRSADGAPGPRQAGPQKTSRAAGARNPG